MTTEAIIRSEINNCFKEIKTVREAAQYLGITERSIYSLIRQNKISYSKPDGRIFILKSELDKYAMSNVVESESGIYKTALNTTA